LIHDFPEFALRLLIVDVINVFNIHYSF